MKFRIKVLSTSFHVSQGKALLNGVVRCALGSRKPATPYALRSLVQPQIDLQGDAAAVSGKQGLVNNRLLGSLPEVPTSHNDGDPAFAITHYTCSVRLTSTLELIPRSF